MKLKQLLTHNFIQEFSKLLQTEFEKKLFIASLRNYCSHGNPLRFHNFAFSMRELILTIINRKAPDNLVKKANWYQKESDKYDVTRRQKLKFCSQGYLSDAYLEDYELETLNDNINECLKKFNFFNKYTHISEKYLEPCPQNFYNEMKDIIQISKNVIDELLLLEDFVMSKLEQKINSEVGEYLINNVPDELSILAQNCIIEQIIMGKVTIESIDEEYISILAEGSVYVTQEYGKGEDYTTICDDYPFSVSVLLSVVDPKIIEIIFNELNIDNSGWFGN